MEVKTDLPAPAWVWKEPSQNLRRIVEGMSLYPEQGQGLYTADQMRAYGESCARMAREEAAKVCEKLAEEGYGDWKHATPTDCAAAIRKG